MWTHVRIRFFPAIISIIRLEHRSCYLLHTIFRNPRFLKLYTIHKELNFSTPPGTLCVILIVRVPRICGLLQKNNSFLCIEGVFADSSPEYNGSGKVSWSSWDAAETTKSDSGSVYRKLNLWFYNGRDNLIPVRSITNRSQIYTGPRN